LIRLKYFEEPLLAFGSGGLHVDPKAGVARYGPHSLGTSRHPSSIRIGMIGTAGTCGAAQEWLAEIAEGVTGNDKHPEFPGIQKDRGYFASLVLDERAVEMITQTELRSLVAPGVRQKDRFQETLSLLDAKLRLLSERDLPPQYVVVALPDALVGRTRVAEYHDKELGMVHRDLRRALKAAAMRYRIPTQLLRESTMDGRDPTHLSKIAWNYMTGLYFKAGGMPWAPRGLPPGSCFIGISFFRPLGSRFARMQTSLVQAFDEHGEGLVLRGHDFDWDSEKEGSRSPHLSADQANELVRAALDRYEQELKQSPLRVIVHKGSRFWPAEQEGFQQALSRRVQRYDLVALAPQTGARLLTTSIYPPLRGTLFSVEETDFLYTTGFLAALNEFHGVHVPAPLQITDHIGQDTARDALLREIFVLTKMNWNSANFGGLLPITLKFARLVGEILREIPADREPLPQFKFYM